MPNYPSAIHTGEHLPTQPGLRIFANTTDDTMANLDEFVFAGDDTWIRTEGTLYPIIHTHQIAYWRLP